LKRQAKEFCEKDIFPRNNFPFSVDRVIKKNENGQYILSLS